MRFYDFRELSRPDANDAGTLNAILWRDRMGDIPVPAPKHTVFAEGH